MGNATSSEQLNTVNGNVENSANSSSNSDSTSIVATDSVSDSSSTNNDVPEEKCSQVEDSSNVQDIDVATANSSVSSFSEDEKTAILLFALSHANGHEIPDSAESKNENSENVKETLTEKKIDDQADKLQDCKSDKENDVSDAKTEEKVPSTELPATDDSVTIVNHHKISGLPPALKRFLELSSPSISEEEKNDLLFAISTDHILGYVKNLEASKLWIEEQLSRKMKEGFPSNFEIHRDKVIYSKDNLVYTVTVYEKNVNSLTGRSTIFLQYNVWQVPRLYSEEY